MARIIIELWEPIADNCFCLKSSKEQVDKHLERLWANGVIRCQHSNNEIVLVDYATFNSLIHNLTAAPGDTIYRDKFFWSSRRQIQGFELFAKTTRPDFEQGVILTETEYEIPAGYTGPRYKLRRIYFAAKTLQIVKVEMEYEDGSKDIGEFVYFEAGEFQIKWTCDYGPIPCSISFI